MKTNGNQGHAFITSSRPVKAEEEEGNRKYESDRAPAASKHVQPPTSISRIEADAVESATGIPSAGTCLAHGHISAVRFSLFVISLRFDWKQALLIFFRRAFHIIQLSAVARPLPLCHGKNSVPRSD